MKRNPYDKFSNGTNPLDFTLLDFWQWNQSNLLSNNLRGHLAEFIVMKALGIESDGRQEWAPYDVITKEGIKIEVKSAAYLQDWEQTKPSTIKFGIAPAAAWDWEIDKRSTEKRRHSDVYVFCVFEEMDRTKANPLDMEQWRFYVLATSVLNAQLGNQQSITLNSLMGLNPISCSFSTLAQTFKNL